MDLLRHIPLKAWRWLLLSLLAVVTVGALAMAVRMRMPILMGIPVALVMGLLILYRYKPVFFLLIASIPLSTQMEVGGSLALDLFSEPLMLVFLVVFVLDLLAGRQFRGTARLKPFHFLILILLSWTVITTLLSSYPGRSFKFLLAKLWYLAPFVYVAQRLIQGPADVKTLFWAFFWPLMVSVLYALVHHASAGFSFEAANGAAFPLYANGVIFSATLVLFLPWCWYARSWYGARSLQWYVITAGMGLLLLGIIFSYKRGAYLTTATLPVIWFLMQRKWLDKLIYVGIVLLGLGVAYLVQGNNYYLFAPNYQSTIWHGDDFEAHLEATLQGTEISGMERFYRWVAAKNMIADMPVFGSGPSTFNQVYKHYADDAFRTYVSDNPEQSTTHNYFLMTFAEQGFPGGLLFFFLCMYMLVKGIRLYYRIADSERRGIVLLLVMSLSTILLHSFLNEMIEVDKIGAMFWLILTLIHLSEGWEEREMAQEGP
ncbi:MAG: hypothetical protein D6722_22510 [Bacteroidetes bacterium]|nr:MAG: hypothetical protein D6722_22510 [Bacteroidota bacterium]